MVKLSRILETEPFRLTVPSWDGNGTVEFCFRSIRVAYRAFASYRDENGVVLIDDRNGKILAQR